MPTYRRAPLSRLIRARAIQRGILGSSPLWRAIALILFGSRFLKRVFGKHPEYLGTEKLEPGQFVRVEAIPPPTKHERRGRREARRLSA